MRGGGRKGSCRKRGREGRLKEKVEERGRMIWCGNNLLPGKIKKKGIRRKTCREKEKYGDGGKCERENK